MNLWKKVASTDVINDQLMQLISIFSFLYTALRAAYSFSLIIKYNKNIRSENPPIRSEISDIRSEISDIRSDLKISDISDRVSGKNFGFSDRIRIGIFQKFQRTRSENPVSDPKTW